MCLVRVFGRQSNESSYVDRVKRICCFVRSLIFLSLIILSRLDVNFMFPVSKNIGRFIELYIRVCNELFLLEINKLHIKRRYRKILCI